MKFISMSFFILLLSTTIVLAQKADDIIGKWRSAHGSGQIEITKHNNHYSGKIIWLKDEKNEEGQPKTDVNNPSQELRTRRIIGLEVITGLEYKGKNLWSNGKVYDPKSGRTYNCQVSFTNDDKLNFRAYYGISILGKAEVWTRVK